MQRLLKSLVLVAFGLVAGVGLAELGLRVAVGTGLLDRSGFGLFIKYLHANPVSDSVYRVSQDPVLGLELIPNSSRGNIRINSSGFRGREFELDPDPDIHRIALLGDSEAFGAMLAEEETIVGALEAALNEGAGPPRFEVLNFGFPGYNTFQESRILVRRAMHFKPSSVVLYYVLNDTILAKTTTLLERSALYESYVYSLIQLVAKRQELSPNQIQHEKREVVDVYRLMHATNGRRVARKIIQMNDFLRRRNVRFIVVIAPEVLGFDSFDEYPYESIHRDLARLAEHGVEVVDPLPALAAAQRDPREFWVTPADCHKNLLANRLIAEVVAERLLQAPPASSDRGSRGARQGRAEAGAAAVDSSG